MAFEYKPGIYKTTKFLPGHEAEIGPGELVLIRTDGEFAPASVLKPVSNRNNQWQFQMPGIKIPSNSLNKISSSASPSAIKTCFKWGNSRAGTRSRKLAVVATTLAWQSFKINRISSDLRLEFSVTAIAPTFCMPK